MTWTFLTENWETAEGLFADYFPHAGKLARPLSVSDLAEVLTSLAESHDLTISETAELLDDLAMTTVAHTRYVNEVTHKIVASS